jgi:hypothetical protein
LGTTRWSTYDQFVVKTSGVSARQDAEKVFRQAEAPVPPGWNCLMRCGGAGGFACQSRLSTIFQHPAKQRLAIVWSDPTPMKQISP